LAAWPKLHEVRVERASDERSHPGFALADAGCNRIYAGLLRDPSTSIEKAIGPMGRSPLFVMHTDTIDALRAIDRSLRDQPPDWIGAARRVARLMGDAAAPPGRGVFDAAATRGAGLFARTLWERSMVEL